MIAQPVSATDMRGGGLERMDTNTRMDVMKHTAFFLPCVWCFMLAINFWVPMVWFFAADNVLPECEIDLSYRMKVYILVVFCLPFVLQFFYVLTSLCGMKALFKIMECLIHGTSAFSGLGLTIMLVVWYTETTEEACYDGEQDLDHYINPRKLMLAWIIIGSVAYCCQALGGCLRVMQSSAEES
jgi:hypothetical protein